MAGLFGVLNAASTALDAQSQAINVTSSNIANINNPNYAREQIVYNDLGTVETETGPESEGVTTSVTQDRSAILDQMVQQQAALTSGYTAQQDVLQQAQGSLGENVTDSSTTGSSTASVSTSGLSAALSDFFNSFESLAANPTDAGQQQTVYQQAGVLTDRFQQIDQNLAQVQTAADAQASGGVTTANGLLQDIAGLNAQIVSAESNDPSSALGLRDQREGDLETLAGLMPITAVENGVGADTVSAATAGGSIALVTGATVTNALSYASGVVSAGSTALTLSSGTIAGAVTASTGPVQALRTSLDQLADQIVTAVNTAYNPGGTGNNFFAATGTTAATISLDPSLTAANLEAGTGSAADNSIATAVAGVANQVFSTTGGDAIDGTLSQFYGGVVSDIGQALDTANTQATDQTNVQTIIQNQRQSVSGVSLDEEMSNLMTYQSAFQASSEIFQTVNTMLQDLIATISGA